MTVYSGKAESTCALDRLQRHGSPHPHSCSHHWMRQWEKDLDNSLAQAGLLFPGRLLRLILLAIEGIALFAAFKWEGNGMPHVLQNTGGALPSLYTRPAWVAPHSVSFYALAPDFKIKEAIYERKVLCLSKLVWNLLWLHFACKFLFQATKWWVSVSCMIGFSGWGMRMGGGPSDEQAKLSFWNEIGRCRSQSNCC